MVRAKVILVDSDVISHFIAAGHIYDLDKILSPHHLLIVEQVYKEATYHPWDDSRKGEVDSWLANTILHFILRRTIQRRDILLVYRYFLKTILWLLDKI